MSTIGARHDSRQRFGPQQFLSLLLGATVIRRAGDRLVELAATAPPGDARLLSLQRRARTLNLVMILLLVSVVFAMVFKPTL